MVDYKELLIDSCKLDEAVKTLQDCNRNGEDDYIRRKETAKEILQELLALSYGQGCVCYDVDIKALAKKYGIELGGIGKEE